MGQASAVGHIGILDLHGNGGGVVGAPAVHHHLGGNGCKAFCYGGNHAVFNGNDIFVAGFVLHSGIIGEVSIQIVDQSNRLRGIHRQFIIPLKEPAVAGITQILVLAVDLVVGLDGGVAGQLEHIGNRLVIAAVALVILTQHSDLEGDGLIGLRITDLHQRIAGGNSHQLIVDDPGHAGLGGGELQQFCPGGIGMHQGLQGIHFIGAQGDALFQSIEIEVHIFSGQADLKGGIVQGVVIAGDGEGLVIQGAFLHFEQVVRQFEGHHGGAVLLRENRSHVLLEAVQLRDLIVVLIEAGAYIADLCGHGVMVVIDANLCVQPVFIHGLVILIVELHALNGGRLKVHSQGELKYIVQVCLHTAVGIVHDAFQADGVLGVIHQIVVHGIELNLDVGRINGAAVAVRFPDIGIHSLEDHFTGGIVSDVDPDLLGGTEHACPDETQGVDGALLIGKGDVILVGGNDHIRRILHEVVGSQVADIVLADAADGTGGVGVCHGLVLHRDGIVQLVGVGIVISQVEHGGLGPVTVEGQVRHIQVDLGTLGCSQGDVALHIHAVGEGGVHIGLVLIAQGDDHMDLGAFACGDIDLVALDGLAVFIQDLDLGTGQGIGLFGNGGLTGIGLGLADTFGEDMSAHFISQLFVPKLSTVKVISYTPAFSGSSPSSSLEVSMALPSAS